MSLEKKLTDDLKSAMRGGDKTRVETIRSIRSELKNKQIAKGRELNEEELIQVLTSAAKKRKEAIEQYESFGQTERAQTEQRELEIIESYLPEQMTEEEITKMVDDTINEVNAASINDLGKVMGSIMPKVKGKADGKVVQNIVRQKLTNL